MKQIARLAHPLAITMWDFSWLERRWPGAGYEDWNEALDALVARGYDAVRIDAYPHLIAAGRENPQRTWELLPAWDQNSWGSPALQRVQVLPALVGFIAACAERDLWVGLSTWWREDRDDVRRRVKTPADLGAVWVAALDAIAEAGLLGSILYVDLSNEFPIPFWSPFFPPDQLRATPEGERWMRDSIAVVRAAYPQLDYCFSFTTEFETWQAQDVRSFDLLEPHIWMAQAGEFYDLVGYHYEKFEPTGYNNLALHGERLYRERPDYWQAQLAARIGLCAEWSRAAGKPLITTECWGVVDYKDWPLLNWGWVKELCAFGVEQAAQTGRWVAIATSNFCGPQFVGMWRDVAWHRALTNRIHAAVLPAI